MLGRCMYHVHRLPIAKDKIYGALNETILEVMAAGVIAKCVLSSIECTIVESCHVACNPECSPLSSCCSRWWYFCSIL